MTTKADDPDADRAAAYPYADFRSFLIETHRLLGRSLTAMERNRARNAFSYRMHPETMVTMIRSGR